MTINEYMVQKHHRMNASHFARDILSFARPANIAVSESGAKKGGFTMLPRFLAAATLCIASGCLMPAAALAQGEGGTPQIPPAHVTWCAGAQCLGNTTGEGYYPMRATWCFGAQCLGNTTGEGYYPMQNVTWCFGAQCLGNTTGEGYYPMVAAPVSPAAPQQAAR